MPLRQPVLRRISARPDRRKEVRVVFGGQRELVLEVCVPRPPQCTDVEDADPLSPIEPLLLCHVERLLLVD
jgi:hypothetical protein